jgi:hypothetical protein
MTSNPIYEHKTQSDKTLKFISKAKLIHGDKFDYSLVEYVNLVTKVKIICKIHGVFIQSPGNHQQGDGCPNCAWAKMALSRFKSTSEFISEAVIKHGNKYNYSLVVYVHSQTKVDIVCPLHGTFNVTPSQHLSGLGCRICRNIRKSGNLSTFISSAKKRHSELYDYSLAEYKKSQIKLNIICVKHGVFAQSPNNHLKGAGCPNCGKGISKIATRWLDSLNIEHLIREYTPPEWGNKHKKVDGYDPLTNTVYQFHGDYWHGNLRKYSADAINANNKKTFGELNRLTKESDDWIRSKGYNLVVMWEMDFNNL